MHSLTTALLFISRAVFLLFGEKAAGFGEIEKAPARERAGAGRLFVGAVRRFRARPPRPGPG